MQPQSVTTVDIKPPSPGPSSPSQHKILNRVSTLFGTKKRNTASTVLLQESNSLQSEVLYDMDDSASRVDSILSSTYSRHSEIHPSNTPAPLRTVQLDNPIVHSPTPPTPPPNETLLGKSESKRSSQKETEIDEQFQLLLKEYAPSADHINSVNNLTSEQKEILLRSSRSPALLKKNSTFSSFSIRDKLGLNKNSKPSNHHHSTSDGDLHSIFHSESNQANKAKTIPARYSRPRAAIYNSTGAGTSEYGTSRRSKTKSTPEYFVHLLQMTHVRDLEDAEVLDLRVFLRSVVVSWTSEFLSLGGYDAITQLFKQMKEAPKRQPNDNRILQHLGKCLKAIMTHQPMGTQIVLLNPTALWHVRDILFGPTNKKKKQVYGLEINTRSLLLNLLCTLATLQTNGSPELEYVHGYDVLRRLLLDRPTDRLIDDDDKKNQAKNNLPFPMTLKTDPQEILQMIMENDPNGQAIGNDYAWDRNELKPRYTAWMRELQFTAEQHIETITFLSQVLNYDFKSVYRQLKSRQNDKEPQEEEEASGSVMTEEGVVEYIITHLRLIRTVVTTPPTSYVGCYDEREQEKIRLELIMCGFDKTSKILAQCPHPTVRESYINYLRPLMSPCADLSRPRENMSFRNPPPLPERSKQYSDLNQLNPDDENDETSDCELYVYADDDPAINYQEVNEDVIVHQQWRYDDEPYDDIFYNEEPFEEEHTI